MKYHIFYNKENDSVQLVATNNADKYDMPEFGFEEIGEVNLDDCQSDFEAKKKFSMMML